MTRIEIRAARREDVGAVLAVWEQARSAAAVSRDDPAAVTRLIDHHPDTLLVAECDGHVVGTLVAAWDGWRGNMYRLAVLESYRRRGIGRRLVEVGHEKLRAKGARRVTALVAHSEDEAMTLWRSAGYELDEAIARLVRNLEGGPGH